MRISIICAIDKKRGIGRDNGLPWKITKDLEHFKGITMGHVMLMGRRTYESIGRPLPGRTTVVVSNNPEFILVGENVHVCRSLEEGIEKAKELEKDHVKSDEKSDHVAGEIFICGGGSIYAQTIGIADKLYLTIVEKDFEADTFFPEYSEFKNVVSERIDSEGELMLRFVELTR